MNLDARPRKDGLRARMEWITARELGGRRAGRTMLGKLLSQKERSGDRGYPGDRKRRMKCQLGNGHWNGDMADVADLTVLIVERLAMPMDEGVHPQRAHHHDEQNGQQPVLATLRHTPKRKKSPRFENKLDAGAKAMVTEKVVRKGMRSRTNPRIPRRATPEERHHRGQPLRGARG